MHMPNVGSNRLSECETVAFVVGSPPSVDAYAGIVVVVLNPRVILVAAAAEKHGATRLVVQLFAIRALGSHAADLARDGVLNEARGAIGEANVDTVAIGHLVKLLEQVHAHDTISTGHVTTLVFFGALMTVVALIDPIDVDAELLAPRRQLLGPRQKFLHIVFVAHRSESAVAEGVPPLVNIDFGARMNMTTRAAC